MISRFKKYVSNYLEFPLRIIINMKRFRCQQGAILANKTHLQYARYVELSLRW
jgi:hypothetical protein